MSITIYQDSKGNRHEIPDDTPFRMGEDWVEVGKQWTPEEEKFNDSINKIAQVVGVTTDQAITMLAKALGIDKCPWCQLRGQILQRMGELGWIETLRRLKQTFKDQFAARKIDAK